MDVSDEYNSTLFFIGLTLILTVCDAGGGGGISLPKDPSDIALESDPTDTAFDSAVSFLFEGDDAI